MYMSIFLHMYECPLYKPLYVYIHTCGVCGRSFTGDWCHNHVKIYIYIYICIYMYIYIHMYIYIYIHIYICIYMSIYIYIYIYKYVYTYMFICYIHFISMKYAIFSVKTKLQLWFNSIHKQINVIMQIILVYENYDILVKPFFLYWYVHMFIYIYIYIYIYKYT
jgi:hypothetical protein